jgi:hypothetical protein
MRYGSGTILDISSGVYPPALVVPVLLAAILLFAVARFAGGIAADIVGAVVVALEAFRWNRGLAGVKADAAWLTEELRRD